MKKTYIIPEIAIVKIGTHQMLAISNASLNFNKDEEEDDIDNLI